MSRVNHRPLHHRAAALAIAAVIFASFRGAAAAPSFRGLGAGSQVGGISADGSTLVGNQGRWTSAGGWEPLGTLPGSSSGAFGRAASADGSVIVGTATDASGVPRAFRWTAATGVVPVTGYAGAVGGYAAAVSADGSVVVGHDGESGFRWTPAGGRVTLERGGTPNSTGHPFIYGLSADGSTVLGSAISRSGSSYQMARWNPAGEILLLEPSVGAFSAASADGSVLVGSMGAETFIGGAVRMTAADGVVTGLGGFPGGTHLSRTFPTAVSADGSVVVGFGYYAASDRVRVTGSFMWDETDGMRNLKDVLVGLELDVTGWDLGGSPVAHAGSPYLGAADLSADGLVIVGNGRNPAGQSEAWIAVLPEPAGVTTFAVLAPGLALLRRRRG